MWGEKVSVIKKELPPGGYILVSDYGQVKEDVANVILTIDSISPKFSRLRTY